MDEMLITSIAKFIMLRVFNRRMPLMLKKIALKIQIITSMAFQNCRKLIFNKGNESTKMFLCFTF